MQKTQKRNALDADITDLLREAIINREEFTPGSPLRIDALASRFGVSHMPVRAALQRLECEGLITALPNKGARVVDVNQAFVSDIMDIRMQLESYLARRATLRMTDNDLEMLSDLQLIHAQAVSSGDIQDALTLNRAFHTAIHHIAGSTDAILILDRHWRLIRALWRRYGPIPARFQAVIADHRQMLAAFMARDSEAAAALAAAHTVRAKHSLLEAMNAALGANENKDE
ncbi:GntR family transcriptional regulator [Rahnella sp. L72c]|uniref:GntR family transcriptional regulator n=1 Tax=Rahnella perminowiae TaxID=2816244 RepID=A0ABS6KVY8_9GAMM|nr:GntR family transcriptional regulator [Rahnella perminowiae]MBU9833583.1 GntR family transcriptional regulator [Rahnella perminowiae]